MTASFFRRCFACCLLLLGLVGTAYATTLTLGADSPARIALRPWAEYYDEALAQLAIEDAVHAPQRFAPAATHRPQLGAEQRWVRLPLRNDGGAALTRLLTLGVPDVEILDAYSYGKDGLQPLLHLAADAPYHARPWPARQLALPLTLAAGEYREIFLRYRTHVDTPLTLELQTPAAFAHQQTLETLLDGAIVGLLAALLLLALLQYLVTEQSAFLAYSLMAGLMIAFLLQFTGYNFAYLWPHWAVWNQAAPFIILTAMQLMQALFTLSLFNLRQRHPRLYRAYLLYALLLPLCLCLLLFAHWDWPALVIGLSYVPLLLASGAYLIWRGRRDQREDTLIAVFFLAGAAGNALFTNVLFALDVFGFAFGFDGQISPFIFPKIGYVCEALFFALALAYQLQALHRQVENSLRRHLAEAEQLARSEGEKHQALLTAQTRQLQLAATGHDLAQPLAAIRLGLAALRAQEGTPGNTGAATRHIDQALDYTESLLHGLISEAKADFASQPDTALLSLDALLDATRQRHLAAAQRKGLHLHHHPTRRRLPASELVLARILDNLVGNAIRYTDRGRILLGVRQHRDGLLIEVRDSGPGFNLARRQQLLAPFSQSGQLEAERLGHGLGLHIVRTLCEQSGYQLLISSQPGRGSIFAVLLPHAP